MWWHLTRTPQYRYLEKAKTIIAKILEQMEERDITETSTASWLSSIVLVSKPDGGKRMCLDYRKVNTQLMVALHPLLRLEEMVDTMTGHKYYTTLDMRNAYYLIVLDEDSRDPTTFSDGVTLY